MTPLKKSGAARVAPKNRKAAISAARKAAFNILLAVERGQSHSDELLRGKAVSALSAPDRNLATALVLGVLRWQISLDHQLHALLSRPGAKLEPEIMIALRVGAFQIRHMDRIPARAAIDESVELAKQAGHRFASGMVNAVLRKLARMQQGDESQEKHPAGAKAHPSLPGVCGTTEVVPCYKAISISRPSVCSATAEESLAEDLALAQVHPAWMVERWISHYGVEAARDLCHHGQSQPVLAVRLDSPAVEAELAAAGITLDAGELLAAARTVVAGEIAATEAFRACRVRFQDEGSQLAAEILCRAGDAQNVKSVLDACAAPGGKTLILAERKPQARIVALESSASRLAQMRKRLAFLGDRVECRLADAAALTEEAKYDLALADVPCSGTGTLGRNPEIRHRLRLADLTRQAERQRAILSAALRAVRPGGRVVYSTCSLEPEENEQVVAAVLAATPRARLVRMEERIGELLADEIITADCARRLRASLTPEGFLRLLPGRLRTDGFFIALIEG